MQDITGPITPDPSRIEAEAIQLLEFWRNDLDPEDEFIDWLHSQGMLCPDAVDELLADPDYLNEQLTQFKTGLTRGHDYEKPGTNP